MPSYALIAFGANIGDPQSNIMEALRRLKGSVTVRKMSSLYRTRAVGGPAGQPDFINAVAEILPDGTARKTMGKLLDIEVKMGRARAERWGPRIIDLDLLDQDGAVIVEPDLKLPHPRIRRRAFVLVPIAEIAPQWRHPVSGLTAAEMLKKLSASDRAVILGVEAAYMPPLR